MILGIEIAVLCLLFWLMCYLGTGTDEKNIKSISSYPDEVIDYVSRNPRLKEKMQASPIYMTLLSNLVLFVVVMFILGFFIKGDSYLYNFVGILILGESLNLFDFLIIDLCWWRNDKRVRFEGTKDNKEMYRSPKKHFYAFLRGIILFLIVALIDAGLLIMF